MTKQIVKIGDKYAARFRESNEGAWRYITDSGMSKIIHNNFNPQSSLRYCLFDRKIEAEGALSKYIRRREEMLNPEVVKEIVDNEKPKG